MLFDNHNQFGQGGIFCSVHDIHIYYIGDYSSYEQKSILSAPIFMDNVACYGSEDKLIDCSYYMDTTEDDHSNDIWINCDTTEQSSDQSTAKAALSISVVLLVFFIVVIVILIIIAVLLYKRKSGASTTER